MKVVANHTVRLYKELKPKYLMEGLSAVFLIILLAFSTGAVFDDTSVYIATQDDSISGGDMNRTFEDASINSGYFIGDTGITLTDQRGYLIFSDTDGIITNVQIVVLPEQNARATIVRLSDGTNHTLMVRPIDASATAASQLKIDTCTGYCEITLKERRVNGEARAIYQIEARKSARLIGFIPSHIKVITDVDAETGAVVNTRKSWWSFAARSDTQAEALNSGTSLSSSSETSASTTGSGSGYK